MVVFSRAHESGWHPRNFFSIATELQRALAKLNERMGSILELSVKLRNVNSVRHHRHTTLDTKRHGAWPCPWPCPWLCLRPDELDPRRPKSVQCFVEASRELAAIGRSKTSCSDPEDHYHSK